MDWPLFALITYGFVLVLIVVLIVLRSRRALRSQYARVLEEKETKLARMQIDLEESMEALDAYAEQLRLDWKNLQKDDQKDLNHLYKKGIDLEASFLTLRARVTAIEVELKREKRGSAPQNQSGMEHAVQPRVAKEAMRQEAPVILPAPPPVPAAIQEPLNAAPLTPAYAPMELTHPHAKHFPAPPKPVPTPADECPQAAPEAPAGESEAPEEARPMEIGDVQQRAQALLEAGEGAAAISRMLNISHTETSLLLKSLFLAKAQDQVQADNVRGKAIEALEKGASPADVARRFDLSLTEVALLAARKAHAPQANGK